MPQVPSKPSCFKTPWLLLSAVGCQPTAPKCLKYPPTLVFQDPMIAFKCCRLPTYSPKMPQVPSKPSCFKTMVAFKCCRLPTYSPKMPQVPSKPSCFKTMVAFKCCMLPTYSPKMPINASSSLQTLVFQDHGCF